MCLFYLLPLTDLFIPLILLLSSKPSSTGCDADLNDVWHMQLDSHARRRKGKESHIQGRTSVIGLG